MEMFVRKNFKICCLINYCSNIILLFSLYKILVIFVMEKAKMKIESLKLETLKIENLKIENLKFENLKFENLKLFLVPKHSKINAHNKVVVNQSIFSP